MRINNPQPYLDIHTTNAVIHIEKEPVRLKVESQRAQMHVTRTRPNFKVNWKKLRAESGVRSPEAQRQYIKQRSQRMLHRNTQNAVSDLQQMGNIQNSGAGSPEIVASVTFNRTMTQNIPEVNVGSMPSSLAQIDWDPGSLEIEWDPHRIEMSWEGDMRPRITVTPHTVEIRLINGKTIRVGENEAKAIEMQGYGKRMDTEV